MSQDDNKYTGVLLEDMNSKMDAVVEAVGQMKEQIRILPAMQKDLEEVKADVKTIKAVVMDQSKQLSRHEQEIQVLKH